MICGGQWDIGKDDASKGSKSTCALGLSSWNAVLRSPNSKEAQDETPHEGAADPSPRAAA